MMKKRTRPLKGEFSRLIIDEGYNNYEAIAIMLIRFMKMIIPILLLFLIRMSWSKYLNYKKILLYIEKLICHSSERRI